MPGDAALPAGACDFPPWQAARLVSGAAKDGARAWTQPVAAAEILDVAWGLHQTFRDLSISLWRLSQFRDEAKQNGLPPADLPPARLHEPGSHIHRAGSAIERAGAVLRDGEVLEHVRLNIARGLPAGGDPEKSSAAVTVALELADSAAMAYRIMGRSLSGTVPERDDAVGAFMRVVDNLDVAVRNLAAHVSGPHSARLAAAQAGLNEAYTHLREALICSAVDFRQARSGRLVRAMRERYPVLPSRSRLARNVSASQAARLADASFPPGSVTEAVGSVQQAVMPRREARASHRPPLQPRLGSVP
jgi:hypothetical protein